MPSNGRSWNPMSGKIVRWREGVKKIIDFASMFESSGGFARFTSRAHAQIHKGNRYTTCNRFEGVSDDALSTLLISNPTADKEYHCTFSLSTEGKAYFELFEGATLDSNVGTPLIPRNHKRNKASNPDDATATVVHSAVFSSNGTSVSKGLAPGGEKSKSIGGTQGFSEERVIGPGQNLMLVVQNKGSASKDAEIQATHYEVLEGSV